MKRRTALGLIGAAAAAPLVKAPPARADMLDLDPSDPAHTLMILRKLAHTMDDSIVYWWAKLSRMVMLEKIATPLWDVWVAAVIKSRDLDERGAYENTAISMVFYTDLETGEYLRTFDNPITGETVEIGYFPAQPSKRIYSVDGPKSPPPSRPGYDVIDSHPLGPALIEGRRCLGADGRYHPLRAQDARRRPGVPRQRLEHLSGLPPRRRQYGSAQRAGHLVLQ